jgi:hypothetical protein
MKIAYVAGFFSQVLDPLQAATPALLADRSVVWIRQRPDRQPDINQLKADLFDQGRRGATSILICIFVFREHEFVLQILEEIAASARDRHPRLRIDIRRFKNARDSAGIITALNEFAPNRDVLPPESLDDLELWAQTHWTGRVFLHPRAVRGARQSEFGDVALIYSSLHLLAEEYWNMRTAAPVAARGRSEAFKSKLEFLGLEHAPSITQTRAGEEGEEYFVAYPLGGATKRLLDFHLKKGSSREPRNCLRIYFFWEGLSKLVVVGWLPSHLDNRST